MTETNPQEVDILAQRAGRQVVRRTTRIYFKGSQETHSHAAERPFGRRCPVRFGDRLCLASGWSAEVDADVEVEVLG
jgi:hypothetical protein